LELGSFLGYSAIRTARELLPGGLLVCIEANPEHAAVVRTLLDYAGCGSGAVVLTGLSSDMLPRAAELLGPTGADFVFMDHAKECYCPDTLALEALGVLRTGSLLVADNVVYPGAPGFLPLVQGNAAKYETRLLAAEFEYRAAWREGLAEGKRDAMSVTRFL
jgi:predicted O-methyltransferase YrrM